jgi:hypothetical protein
MSDKASLRTCCPCPRADLLGGGQSSGIKCHSTIWDVCYR